MLCGSCSEKYMNQSITVDIMHPVPSKELSVVIPVYNEAGALPGLHKELVDVLSQMSPDYEIIYINDGSTDATATVLRSLAGATAINLNRNYGQATALDAGFQAATGRFVVSLDGDGQNDPRDIPRMVQYMYEQRLDVVCGWRKDRKDKGGFLVLTRIGRFLRHRIIRDVVHDTGCTLRVYTLKAARSLDLQGEMHRYILALLRWKGYSIGELVVNHRAREHGVSKYGYSKAVRGFIDLIYIWFIHKYSQRPLHLFGYMSLVACALGMGALGWTIYGKLFMGLSLNRNGWFFLSFFFLLAAIMLFSFGIIMDLLIRIYHNVSPREKRYHIRDVYVSTQSLAPTLQYVHTVANERGQGSIL